MHCSWRRLIRRGLEFHVCTINKSAHTKKGLKLQGLWLHLQRKDGANSTCLLTSGPRHKLRQHFSWCTARRHARPIALHHLSREKSIYKIKENGFKLTEERSRGYPAKTIIDAYSADDMALLENAFAEAETLLHCLERDAAGISLHVNVHKTEYMSFNQTGNISTQNGNSLKLVDKFTNWESSVSSTETDINTWLAKAWAAINRLSVIWKSDLTDKIKRSFFSKQQLWRYCYMDALHGR